MPLEVEGERESRGCPMMTMMMSSNGSDRGSGGGGCVGEVIKERQLTVEALAGRDSLASNDHNNK
jgi:hypothetical protein